MLRQVLVRYVGVSRSSTYLSILNFRQAVTHLPPVLVVVDVRGDKEWSCWKI